MTLNMAATHGAELCQQVITFLLVFVQICGVRGKKIVHNSLKELEGPALGITLDLLPPYKYFHGPRHKNRFVRDCQPAEYGNITYSLHQSHSDLSADLPVVEQRQFVKDMGQYSWNKNHVYGHHFIINNPELTVSVLEPGTSGGCSRHSVATVAETAKQKNCIVAVNAGFFNTTSHHCLGNLVSDGREVFNSGGIQNAHFGITKNGSLYFGYIPEDHSLADHFSQLVGGVIWLVRDGENYVDQSKLAECSDSQETGNLQTFIDVQSARTAVGHDADGRLIIVQVEGKSWQRGTSLYDLAELLIELGAVNAINLDGGGSSSAVVEGVLVNYPSDSCEHGNFTYGCARKVSSVLCVHDLPCSERCNGHGDCVHGQCHCHDYWAGPACTQLQCSKKNCSSHGTCTPTGCDCHPGWIGGQCEKLCKLGWYGHQCRNPCNCKMGHYCNPHTGQCYCPAGFMGFHCEQECLYGTYGEDCRGMCDCPSSCGCDHVTGDCHLISTNSTLWQAGHCLGHHLIVESNKLVVDPQEVRIWFITIVILCLISVASMVLNISLICTACHRHNKEKAVNLNSSKRKKHVYKTSIIDDSSSADDEFSDDSFENIAMRKMHTNYSLQLSEKQNNLYSVGNAETSRLHPSSGANNNYMLEL